MDKGICEFGPGSFWEGEANRYYCGAVDWERDALFLVDGGRDFCGTTKADGSAWMIALEHPFDASLAVGEFELRNCALACSGISQRKVKDFHHFMDIEKKAPVKQPVGVFASAKSAMVADGMGTAIAVTTGACVSRLKEKFDFDFALVRQDGGLVEEGFEDYLYV